MAITAQDPILSARIKSWLALCSQCGIEVEYASEDEKAPEVLKYLKRLLLFVRGLESVMEFPDRAERRRAIKGTYGAAAQPHLVAAL
ncbi:hypothetical protein LTR95_009857 [Oleoguttula sp. CCFEE 5521]